MYLPFKCSKKQTNRKNTNKFTHNTAKAAPLKHKSKTISFPWYDTNPSWRCEGHMTEGGKRNPPKESKDQVTAG